MKPTGIELDINMWRKEVTLVMVRDIDCGVSCPPGNARYWRIQPKCFKLKGSVITLGTIKFTTGGFCHIPLRIRGQRALDKPVYNPSQQGYEVRHMLLLELPRTNTPEHLD